MDVEIRYATGLLLLLCPQYYGEEGEDGGDGLFLQPRIGPRFPCEQGAYRCRGRERCALRKRKCRRSAQPPRRSSSSFLCLGSHDLRLRQEARVQVHAVLSPFVNLELRFGIIGLPLDPPKLLVRGQLVPARPRCREELRHRRRHVLQRQRSVLPHAADERSRMPPADQGARRIDCPPRA